MEGIRLGLYEKATPDSLSWTERLAAARRAGFDFLEISIDESPRRLSRLEYKSAVHSELSAAMQETGLPIRTMCLSGHRKYPLGSRDQATRERGMDIFQKAVQMADALGIRLIQLAGYDVYYEESGSDTRRMFAENLRRCVSIAAKYGVPLGFETMETPFMDTVGKAMAYVDAIQSPYLGVYPDLGNLTNAAALYKRDLYEDIRLASGHMFAMHLKETRPGVYRDMNFGEGHVDFTKGVASARAQGVSMFVTEMWDDGKENWLKRLSGCASYIRNLRLNCAE